MRLCEVERRRIVRRFDWVAFWPGLFWAAVFWAVAYLIWSIGRWWTTVIAVMLALLAMVVTGIALSWLLGHKRPGRPSDTTSQ